MKIEMLYSDGSDNKVDASKLQSYVEFRGSIPKPSSEEAHLRHILRFYISRAFSKTEGAEVYVLPTLKLGDQKVQVDVASLHDGAYSLAITEPASVTPETEDKLELLKKADQAEVLVVHSSYADAGNMPEKFKKEMEAGRFRLLAIVPPPFDDVYEYDIWMFEETFREIFASE